MSLSSKKSVVENTRIVAKVCISLCGRNVIALYSNFIGHCPLSELHLTYMTFQELAILSSLGSHLYSLMQPSPVSLMPKNIHCNHNHHLYVACNHKFKKLNFLPVKYGIRDAAYFTDALEANHIQHIF